METTNLNRSCPKCGKIITYSNKNSMYFAEKNKSKCRSCSVTGENNPMFGMYGNKNPFFGKKHTEESKKKIVRNRDESKYKTFEFREKISKVTSGNKNPMFGRSVYSVWVEKYGEETAMKKMEEYKLKQSKLNSGSKNSMYGKPTPKGSGNGWSGWYKGWFFRSLMELSYMINVIEKFNLVWESAETDKFVMKFIDNGVERTYRPDFFIGNKYLVEIKPKKLWNSYLVNQKKNVSILFCEKNNYKYKLRDVPKISYKEIVSLVENDTLIFTDRYKKKYDLWRE